MNHLDKVIRCFPQEARDEIEKLGERKGILIEEIRVYKDRPFHIFASGKHFQSKTIIRGETINTILNNLMKFSYYAYEEDIARGFITIDGGHRVGICGKVTLDKGNVRLIRDVSSLNIRYSREVTGIADKISDFLIESNGKISNLLIVSPPGCGKTTLLRDIARYLSQREYKISICDERSEIAGVYNGIPSYTMGPMVDVLDGCPKAAGMIMLIRAMSPDAIIADEVGKEDDIDAIETCVNSGVSIITSLHGNSISDVKASKMGPLIDRKLFHNIILLSDKPRTGTIREVIND